MSFPPRGGPSSSSDDRWLDRLVVFVVACVMVIVAFLTVGTCAALIRWIA